MTETSQDEIARCEALLTDLKAQERKLMERDYRGEISDGLFFAAIWISHEDVERSQLTQPFDEIRVVAQARQIVENAAGRRQQESRQDARNRKAPAPDPGTGALALSSITTSMVELEGLEPSTSAMPWRRSPS